MSEAEVQKPEWFCVKTQTKREHIAANHLRALEGVEVFCPRLRYRKVTRRGKVWWIEPLFPGYVLARFDLIEMERMVTFCQGVRGLVRFGWNVPSVGDNFVESLRHEIRARNDHAEDVVTASPIIELGDEVEIAVGPLRGMSGSVVSIAPARERVRILLDFLGQPHPVDVDLFSILLPRRPISSISSSSPETRSRSDPPEIDD